MFLPLFSRDRAISRPPRAQIRPSPRREHAPPMQSHADKSQLFLSCGGCFGSSRLDFTTIRDEMGNNLTEAGRKQAEIRAKKRAEALRANLKRRKESEAAREDKGKDDAKSENSQ